MTETEKPPQLPIDDIDPFEPITMLEEVQQYPINVSDNTIPEPTITTKTTNTKTTIAKTTARKTLQPMAITLDQTVIPNPIETTECVDWVVVSSQKAIGSVDDQEFYEKILYPEPITVLLLKQMENGYIDVTFTQKIFYPEPITVLCFAEKPAEYVERIFYPEPIPVQYPTERAEELGEQEFYEQVLYPDPITIIFPKEKDTDLFQEATTITRTTDSVDEQECYEKILYPEPITVLLPKQKDNGYIDVIFIEKTFYPEPIRVLCHTGKPAEYIEKLFYPEPITIMCPTERAEELCEQELYEQVLYPDPITILCPMEKDTDLFQEATTLKHQVINMADQDPVEAIPVAIQAPKKKRKPGHEMIVGMIAGAITSLKERSGSSWHAIIGYIVKNYDIQAACNKAAAYILASLKKGVADGIFKSAGESGKGASKYRLVAPVKKKQEPKAKKSLFNESRSSS